MQYSPVCDINPSAYLAYLAANVLKDGSGAEQLVYGSGGGGCDAGVGSCDGDGSSLVAVFAKLCASQGRWDSSLVVDTSVGCGVGRICDVAAVGSGCGEEEVVGLAGGHAGCVGGCLDSGHCLRCRRDDESGTTGWSGLRECDADGSGGSGPVPLEDGSCDGSSVGALGAASSAVPTLVSGPTGVSSVSQTRKEKTRRKKYNRRLRKAQVGLESVAPVVEAPPEVDEVPEWRRKKEFSRSDFVRQGPVPRTAKARGEEGYFSACAPEVRQALRDSRAKMLIAKNEAEAAKYLNGIHAADGVVGRSSEVVDFLMEVKKVVGVVGGLKKSAEVAKIGGWVQTVIDSALSDVSSRKPSSVPALDLKSIGSLGSVSVSGEERLVEGEDVVTLRDLGPREKLERLKFFSDVLEEEIVQRERDGIAVRMHAMMDRGMTEEAAYQPACSGIDIEIAVQTYYRNLAKSRPLTKFEERFRDNVKAEYTQEQRDAMANAKSFEEMDELLVEFDG